ncbi:type II toxin-antitoxin system RelE/ParE family toxin [Paraburkholderia silviterrae]|uniref:Type II toxin-antitoxin system RelE/ParE family toxin n=1 Tax=Paraburkholderia silviterrae TaxID=2528715 RepID=A0A4R5MD67_9BURK|nr:type II toxin-antitoxin system RelE/ParE family toxin [Paraburkholderia silviterrae]TDG24849.1 type II toxin-antitoxin system RelE/ParE family toxin [Paraburkholderia silviterrae]
MTPHTTAWTVRLTDLAKDDFSNIVGWTIEQFGPAQGRAYATTLSLALQDLTNGPSLPGVRARDEIVSGIMTLHVARNRRKGRHFVMFRVNAKDARTIDVLRILHDAMDLPQHL